MKCQKCNKRILEQNHRWCTLCSQNMNLEQKIQAQADYKAKMEKLRLERLHQFDGDEL